MLRGDSEALELALPIGVVWLRESLLDEVIDLGFVRTPRRLDLSSLRSGGQDNKQRAGGRANTLTEGFGDARRAARWASLQARRPDALSDASAWVRGNNAL